MTSKEKQQKVKLAKKLLREKKTWAIIAQELGYSTAGAAFSFCQRNLGDAMKPKRVKIDVDEAVRLRREGKTIGQIARKFKVSKPTVGRAISKVLTESERNGLRQNKNSPRASWIDKAEKLRREGLPTAAIAERFGVSRQRVYQVLNRKAREDARG